jgi:hypothetical protein
MAKRSEEEVLYREKLNVDHVGNTFQAFATLLCSFEEELKQLQKKSKYAKEEYALLLEKVEHAEVALCGWACDKFEVEKKLDAVKKVLDEAREANATDCKWVVDPSLPMPAEAPAAVPAEVEVVAAAIEEGKENGDGKESV